jgi:hypothetical protein
MVELIRRKRGNVLLIDGRKFDAMKIAKMKKVLDTFYLPV